MSDPLLPNAERAIAFLYWLNPDASLHLEHMRSEGAAKPTANDYSSDDTASATHFVSTNNGDNYRRNIYFFLNGEFLRGERKKENLSAARFLHVDLDCKDYPGDENQQRDTILGMLADGQQRPKGIPMPTAVWFTGGGYQAVWRMAEPISVDDAEDLNRALLAAMQGGPGTHDASRLLRLPHTVNWLNDKKRESGRSPALALVMEPLNFSVPPASYQVTDFKLRLQKKQVPGTSMSKPMVLEPLPLPDDLHEILPTDAMWMEAIVTGKNPPGNGYSSRSELVFASVFWMLGNGVKAGHVLSIITDARFGISAHVLEQPNPLAYGYRQVNRAMSFLEARRNGWPIVNKEGLPTPNLSGNIRHALATLGVDAQRNMFTQADEITGHGLEGRDLNDIGDILSSGFSLELKYSAAPRAIIRELIAIAHDQQYHPIIDYLDGLVWDGIPRIDKWLSNYCGAEDTELNREFGSKLLIAGVRRIRKPGIKFDTMLVLEGPQGAGKSRLTATLAIRGEWFCGSLDLKSDDKTKAELLSRAWIVECQELDGLNKATSHSLKRFLSTPSDIYRAAYARNTGEYRRHCIIIGTTNEGAYLQDLTGNRRIWPVRVGTIDIDRFGSDVDQLWAEAVVRERAGESITLSEPLWAAAGELQAQRMVEDAYADVLEGAFVGKTGKVSMDSVKMLLGIDTARMTPRDTHRIKAIMAGAGWVHGTHRLHDLSARDQAPRKGFACGTPDERKVEYLAERTQNGIATLVRTDNQSKNDIPF